MSIFRLALFLSLSAVSVFAQTFRGDLAGIVTDASGAALAGAAVKVESPSTGLNRSAVTSGAGDYAIAELPVGSYNLTVSMPGFEVRRIENIEIAVAKTTNISVQLGVATQQSVVEVSAAAVTLETSASALVANVDDKSVQEMPMNGRDFTQMLKLAPGVTPVGTSSVNGTRTNAKNFQIDGADNNDAYSNAVAVNQGGVAGIAGALVPIEAIDEFSMESNASADAGRNAGGAVQMVIKSGTNELHGSVFFFDRNEDLAWPSPVQTPGTRIPEIRNNQFGFAAGGPIKKNKLFFFTTGEVQLAVAGLSILESTPSPAWVAAGEQVLAKYNVPVNQVSLNLLGLFPSSVLTGPGAPNNYLANALNTYNSYNGIVKLDYRFSDKHTFAIRYLGGTGTQVADVGSNIKDYFQEAPMHVHNFSAVENDIWTPRLVNQITAGTNYFLQTFNDFNVGFNAASFGLNLGTIPGGAPDVKINGFDYTGATPPLGRTDVVGHLTDNLSYTNGRHQWKFGGEYRHANVDVYYFSNSRGTFTFDGTRGPWSSDSTVSSQLKSLSDFLAGEPSNSSGATIVFGDPEHVYRYNAYSGWIHDTFQVTKTLSVNYGVRWDYEGAPYVNGGLYNFLPATGFSLEKSLYSPSPKNFGPRAGLAWTPGQNWVIRAGFGVYYDVPAVSEFTASGSTGNGGAAGLAYNPVGSDAVYSLIAKNVLFAPGVPVFGTVAATPPFGAFSVNPNFTMPHVMNFNFNVQRQLSKSTLLQAAFVGSEGRKLGVILDINQTLPSGVRPYATEYPTLAAVNQLNSAGDSAYNSLQVSLRQQLWKGLIGNVNYTWSHEEDDASSVTSPQNSYCLKCDWASGTFDQRQVMTAYVTYNIPQPNFWKPVTGGWQLNSLFTFATGNPVNILVGSNVSGSGENKDRPNLIGDPYTNLPSTGSLAVYYLNPAAFAKPAAGSFGDLGRDAIYAPGFHTVDFSVFKNFPVFRERVKGQFRAEIFNLFNEINWAAPTATFTSGSFGELTATKNSSSAPGIGFGEPRNIQLALKFIF
jgi:Carboxypeptidase regulatory-like domain/TonB dependent receptor